MEMINKMSPPSYNELTHSVFNCVRVENKPVVRYRILVDCRNLKNKVEKLENKANMKTIYIFKPYFL